MSTKDENGVDDRGTVGGNNEQESSTICDFCQSPISKDEMLNGMPIRLPSGEPVCLECHADLQDLHREAEKKGEDFDPPEVTNAETRCGVDLDPKSKDEYGL